MKINQFPKILRLFASIIIAFSYSFLIAQQQGETCQLPTGIECHEHEPGDYKVIGTTKTFSQMIADGDLLQPALSETQPQFLVVCQRIIDDMPGLYTFAEGSEIIFLDNIGGLEITPAAIVRIKGTYIHGCQKLWGRIWVKGRLELSLGCRIEDAVTAVQLDPNSIFISTGTTFDGNYRCIVAGTTGNPNQHVITATIGGNVFSGQKELIEHYIPNPDQPTVFYSKPVSGIFVSNVRMMTIGVNGAGNLNRFRDFSYSLSNNIFGPKSPSGIDCENSNVTIRNCIFQNIAPSVAGIGIRFLVSPNNTTSTVDITGIGKDNLPTFENIAFAVSGFGNLNVRASHFNNVAKGIDYGGVVGAYNVTVDGNFFENVANHSIEVANISPIKSLNVKNNRFNDNDLYSDDFINNFPRSGLYIHSNVSGQQTSWIYNNAFINSSKTGAFFYANRGVWIQNLNGSRIERNEFTDNFGTTPNKFEGVTVYNASTQLWTNSFQGPGYFETHPSTGIQVLESPACFLSCNRADLTKVGVEFQGTNCDMAKVTFNTMNTHEKGLLLRSDAILSVQNNLYNKWEGNTSSREALFEGRDLGNQSDVFFVKQSQFRIHTPDMNTDFWPNPRFVGNGPDNGTWFVPGTPSIATYLCIETHPGGGDEASTPAPLITDADANVLAGTFEPVRGYAAGLWEAEVRLYRKLAENPLLRPTGSEAADWYAHQDNSVGRLGSVYHGLLSLSNYSATDQNSLDLAATTMQGAAQAVANKDEQIANALSNPAAMNQYLTEREQLNQALATAADAYQIFMSVIRSARLAAAQQLLTQLNGINTTEGYETDFKTVCGILLETYLSETAVSETNLQALTAIAHQCRYAGGLAVLQARASLKNEWDWAQYDNCPELSQERNIRNSAAISFNLYPNPAINMAILELNTTVPSGIVTLQDLTGRIIQEWPLEGQSQLQLQWNRDIPSGMYLLEVKADQAPPQICKLIIENH